MNTRFRKPIIILTILCMLLLNVITLAAADTSAPEDSEEVEEITSTEISDEDQAEESQEEEPAEEVPQKADPLENMEIVAENGKLILYINKETSEIAVKEKANGMVWFSNPEDRANDPLAREKNKDHLGSQITLKYYTPKANLPQMDNYNDSININNFKLEPVDNGIKIVYRMGEKIDRGRESLPLVITNTRLNEMLINKLPEEEGNEIKYQYTKYDLSTVKTKATADILKSKFKQIENDIVWELKDPISDFKLKGLFELFDKAGYTTDDLIQDNLENGIEVVVQDQIIYTIPLEYTLEDDSLVVRVIRDEIQGPANYPLHLLRILEYFGAGSTGDTGYIFVPDGSGALINLNNKKSNYLAYSLPLYGDDLGVFRRTKTQINEITRLPVYGMKRGDHAFFAIIEEGETSANVVADVAGRVHSYNTAFSEFVLTPTDNVTVFGRTADGDKILQMRVYQTRLTETDIKIRYAFLSGKDASYVGMAKYYQDYLVKKHDLKKLTPKENIPFYLEVIGGIYKKKPILGIPFNIYLPLTKYDQALQIIDELNEGDIDNIKLKYTGWFNGGVNHKIPNKIKADRQLGGNSGFKNLVSQSNEGKFELYPDVALQNIYKLPLFFNKRKEIGWYMNKNSMMNFQYNMVSYVPNFVKGFSYLLSPKHLGSYVDRFLKAYDKLKVGGVSLRDLGNEILYSDFRREKEVDRQQANAIITEQIKKIKDSGYNILIDGGNASAIPYAKSILNIPLDSSHLNICDDTVPFYQMVIHGYIEYAGEPINLAQDYKRNILKVVETGAGIYYKWIYADSHLLKDTNFDGYYSINYKERIDEAKELYGKVNSFLKDVQDQKIVNHEILQPNVYKTTYENGKAVIVNYNKNMVFVDGIKIQGEDYYEVKGGDQR